jgi:hypothetical protein
VTNQIRIWVLVTYYGSSGDDVAAFVSREDAEACALKYAQEKWPSKLGQPPGEYSDALEAWDEHGLWGSFDSRWELAEVPVE